MVAPTLGGVFGPPSPRMQGIGHARRRHDRCKKGTVHGAMVVEAQNP